jgi:putative SOS response-associated peptidase YedK
MLAFLAPDITAAILGGRQPLHLSADVLREVAMARWGLIPFWMKEKISRRCRTSMRVPKP